MKTALACLAFIPFVACTMAQQQTKAPEKPAPNGTPAQAAQPPAGRGTGRPIAAPGGNGQPAAVVPDASIIEDFKPSSLNQPGQQYPQERWA